ncbi:hypothetical protein RND81_02G131600 [Saponaria officinalis]|uniref:Uncharacterized protein n=1 Tax=Saponaria officinalis TaxID=3572 RepID=A0AAW1MVC7_SAPOF
MEGFSSSFNYPTLSLNNLTKKTLFKTHKTHLQSSPISPFYTINSPLLNPKNPRIIARFNRPTKRRNSLRKKLTGDSNNSQVNPKNPNLIDPIHPFVDNQAHELNVDGVNLEINGGKVGNFENGSKKLGDSVLWSKFENWVDLYKKDIDFWGIGSNPIFIVFQDSSNGKVDKVFVDENEILRRNGVDPLYFKDVCELEEFNEVNSKISHARFLAKELESGKNVINGNSSVAKFVVSSEGLGFISRIRSISVPKNVVIKVSKIGIAVVCGVFFVWTVKTLLGFGGKEAELTSFEKEMLRRKMKARLEKEKKENAEKGSVEIVDDVSESADFVTKRPQFDKEVVLDGIRKAKGLSSDLAVVDIGGSSTKTDFRIKEIQKMARRAREIEKGECSASEGNDVGKENLIELKNKSSEVVDSVEFDDLEKQSSSAPPAMDKYVVEEHVEGRIINGISKTKFAESDETSKGDCRFPNDGSSEGIENVEFRRDSSETTTIDKKSRIRDEIDRRDSSDTPDLTVRDLSDVSSRKMNPSMKKPVRRMPKIIRSVKEAREYLSLKNDKKAEVGDVSVVASPADAGTVSYVSQRLGKDDKVIESSDVAVNVAGYESVEDVKIDINIESSDAAVNIAEYESVEDMKTDINMLNKEVQMDIMPLSNIGMDKDFSVDIERISERARDVDEMLEHSNGEAATNDASLCVNDGLSSSSWLDKVVDVAPKPTNSSEKSDHVPDKVSSYDVSDLNVLDTYDGSAYSVNLLERSDPSNVKGLNGTLKPTTSTDMPFEDGPAENVFVGTDDETNFNKNSLENKLPSDDTYLGSDSNRGNTEGKLVADKESWLEKNFHEMDPIIDKIRSGFRDSYMVAREKVKQDVGTTLDFKDLTSLNNDMELEWMKDDKLREIVFKVRDNELAGRDPFHSMDLDDKTAFFKGLESIVEKENQNLANLHLWLHSNIENLDYGADGISIYDPPAKFVPRWKGPPIDEIPDFLTNNGDHQKGSYLQKCNQSTEHNDSATSQETSITKPIPEKKVAKFPKTVIEGSDGSIKPGKKSGKEYWQHTKKWSHGFLESYNAESDPEVKATMKDIGKDLDRWITEKEIKEAADLMEKIPERGKAFIEKKMKKLKREMELFGPQAVVSKYHEYADDKEEDYLWWLDVPHVLVRSFIDVASLLRNTSILDRSGWKSCF